MTECKTCKFLNKRLKETKKRCEDKEKELVNLSRAYTRALHTIDLLNEILDKKWLKNERL